VSVDVVEGEGARDWSMSTSLSEDEVFDDSAGIMTNCAVLCVRTRLT
jgi:hypothetical protein